MEAVLLTWVGKRDLEAITCTDQGPVLSTLKAFQFSRVVLLSSYSSSELRKYKSWLVERLRDSAPSIESHHEPLNSPIDFTSIYQVADRHLQRLHSGQSNLSILLSPGTPAMQAVWILLGKTKYPVTFYQSSREQGVEQVEIPFNIAAEYIPSAVSVNDQHLANLINDQALVHAAFDDIITQDPNMLRLKKQAQILAEREVPVLIQGETGTGKELFARAIHNVSRRANQPFIALNCGAIPPELIDTTLFGHKKGAFTGAASDRAGVFQQAHGGTLFLDEFGELTTAAQVRLLRAIQEGLVTPVGSQKEESVDVRIITATHRNLIEDIANGGFREDLFYRVAVGVLTLPPLRSREGDLLHLSETLLAGLAKQDKALEDKKLSVDAKNLILLHLWPGNIRELRSTILRASLWSSDELISGEEMQQAFFHRSQKQDGLLDRDVSQGVDIQDIISELVGHYVPRALLASQGNKSDAAKLLGLKNYQTLNNWIEKHRVKIDN
ncbi:sigma 54-interacting transcriptional regulator [Marinomonas piezotolerans]|nr:sigma 54-interacting transcriptional regulator [Marinomonas piezotolerans]